MKKYYNKINKYIIGKPFECQQNKYTIIRNVSLIVISAIIVIFMSSKFNAMAQYKPTDTESTINNSNSIQTNIQNNETNIDIYKHLSASINQGYLTDITLTDNQNNIIDHQSSIRSTSWEYTKKLNSDTQYHLLINGIDNKKNKLINSLSFKTVNINTSRNPIKIQSITPSQNETVGIGMPITITFNQQIPKSSRKNITDNLQINNVDGNWAWINNKTAVYRTKNYWTANTNVSLAINIYGQKINNSYVTTQNKNVDFKIGDSIVINVNGSTNIATVLQNNQTIKSIPITTGKDNFKTHEGIFATYGKSQLIHMDSNTVGIPSNSTESYSKDVYWDIQLTTSGTYMHAAPWSNGHFGRDDVSHGCVGMSTENAQWLYNLVHTYGDIVNITHTGGNKVTLDNGYGYWNLSWAQWQNLSDTTNK